MYKRGIQTSYNNLRVLQRQLQPQFAQSRLFASGTNANTVRDVHDAEKKIAPTESGGPVKGGPTATTQSHATSGDKVSSQAVHDAAKAEQKLTGQDGPVKGGPTATLQSKATKGQN